MKKLLIVGASILQLPAIIRAKELGYHVGVVDYDPKAVGIPYADEYFNVSTIDIDGVVDVAQKFKPNGIMTLATDMPVRAVAKACEVCNLPGVSLETAIKATDKGEMIKAFEINNVEHPWYYLVRNKCEIEKIADMITYPCIMKPTDNAGSRGVVLNYSIGDLRDNYEYAYSESRNGVVIIEEYLDGPEVSVEVMVMDGFPHVLQITDKVTTGSPHFVEMGHSQPSNISEEYKENIKDLACRACKALGIDRGPAHVEMIITDKGPKMVELGARMGGDCITTHLVPLSTGIDMVGSSIKAACGEKIDITPKFHKGSAIRYLSTKEGVIKSIDGVEDAMEIVGVQNVSIVRHVGERIGEIDNSADRMGFVIAQADTAEDAVRICVDAVAKIKVTVE